jgi:hypothetical protein
MKEATSFGSRMPAPTITTSASRVTTVPFSALLMAATIGVSADGRPMRMEIALDNPANFADARAAVFQS